MAKASTLRERALKLLAQRERSRVELRRKLLTRGTEPQEVDALLDEFAQAGWLSDQRFADARVRSREGTVSRRFIVSELKQHGVDADVAADAVAHLDPDDYDTALALWQRKFGAMPRNDKEKARQVRWLQARGFSLGMIFKLLRAQGAAGEEE